MFKKLFGPTPEDLLLSEIRKRLIPLGFTESNDTTYPYLNFSRDQLLVRWIKDYRDQMYWFLLYVGTVPIKRPDGTIFESPKEVLNIRCPLSNKSLVEFRVIVLEALDGWLKTI